MGIVVSSLLVESRRVLKDFDRQVKDTFPEDWSVRAYFSSAEYGSPRLLLLFARIEDFSDQHPWFRFEMHASYAEDFNEALYLAAIEEGDARILRNCTAIKPALQHALEAFQPTVFERLAAIEP